MIDIHCHILPGFDDGAADLDESLGMARIASASGVTDIVVTPHFRGEEESLSQLSRLLSRYQALSGALRTARIPLSLHLGAEILCLPQTPRLARQGKLPTLGDTRYLLCEFYFNESAAYMDKQLSALTAAGYRVVVAHPERYGAVQRDPRVAARWFRAGYVLQVNKDSLLGALGPKAEQTARHLLDNGLVHIIASDAHSTLYRTADMNAIRSWLSEHCPAEYAALLLEDNPRRLLQGRDMAPSS